LHRRIDPSSSLVTLDRLINLQCTLLTIKLPYNENVFRFFVGPSLKLLRLQ
jgi:hypothetical protein